jgi:hypothetical protein
MQKHQHTTRDKGAPVSAGAVGGPGSWFEAAGAAAGRCFQTGIAFPIDLFRPATFSLSRKQKGGGIVPMKGMQSSKGEKAPRTFFFVDGIEEAFHGATCVWILWKEL